MEFTAHFAIRSNLSADGLGRKGISSSSEGIGDEVVVDFQGWMLVRAFLAGCGAEI